MEQTLRVCIYGATGYTASELLRKLLEHPYVRITDLVSSSNYDKKLSEVFPSFINTPLENRYLVKEPQEDFDLAFLCLPHEISLELVPELRKKGKKVIDLSGAYRIKNKEAYKEFYGFEHRFEKFLEESVYGLTEVFRDEIKYAELVANPGCYPTATLLALYPLLKNKIELENVIVHALSGISGAGRKPKQHFHFPEMTENFFNYSVEKHRHTPEMEDVIKRVYGKEVKVRFTPTVVPVSRGMISTVYVKTEKVNLRELFLETYKNEPFVRVIDELPKTKYVLGTNMCLIYPFYDERTKIAVIISVIDNLGKGASLQAIQNMNVMLGFEETTGLKEVPLFP